MIFKKTKNGNKIYKCAKSGIKYKQMCQVFFNARVYAKHGLRIIAMDLQCGCLKWVGMT